MPHNSVIYHKSAKGTQAIQTRDHALPPKLRSLLIMIDGKRGFDDLAKVCAMLGDPEVLLSQLLDEGYIEVLRAAPAKAPAPVTADQSAPDDGQPRVPLRDAQRYAVRRLTDILGPTGESLCLKIEGTKNAHDFMQAIQRAEMVLRDFGGDAMAESFAQDMKSHRPA